MDKQTGATYLSSKYAKALMVAEPKEGKSCFLVASALGVLPWQRHGGVVDRPEHLHILTFDQGALVGVDRFITQSCKAGKEALAYNVYNFQDDVRRVCIGEDDYDFSIHNGIISTIAQISEQAKRGGTHVVVVSSLTRMVEAVQRGLFGPPAKRTDDARANRASRGQADENKWGKFAQLVSEIRDYIQVDDFHTIWEGHITTSKIRQKGATDEYSKEVLAIQGRSSQTFPLNVEQVFRVRRSYGQRVNSFNVDEAYLDCKPSLDFVCNGRSFNEAGLTEHEMDMTTVFHKLGLRVGQWGKKTNNKQQEKEQ